MSKNKLIKVNNNNSTNELHVLNSRRDSFSDRFCDDLSEVLLSFVSFEDKIRFECVSHQFQRLIFNKQFVIKLSSRESNGFNHLNKLIKKCGNNLNAEEIDVKSLEIVLRKCQFINELSIQSSESNEKVLKLITKYCNYLKKIQFDFSDISEKVLKLFGLKCGPKLRSIEFSKLCILMTENYRLLLKSCPHLEEVFNVRIDGLIDENRLLVSKLKRIEGINRVYDKNLVKILFNGIENTVKSLQINFEEVNDKLYLMEEISRLKKLEKLKLNLFIIENQNYHQLYAESFKKIAINCSQLKRLELNSIYMLSSLSKWIFNYIHFFNQIHYLVIHFRDPDEDFHFSNDLISIELLKNCKNLTNLTISSYKTNDYFFKDIHLYLPQLRHLNIGINLNTSDATLNSITKLSHLKTIEFGPIFSFGVNDCEFLTESGVCHLINNCSSIESISIGKGIKISQKIIDNLITMALKRPKTNFVHYLTDVNTSALHLESLPKNIMIIIT